MGIVLLLLLAGIEIIFAIWTVKKAKEKNDWRRNRLISRSLQLLTALIAVLLPFGQKWRIAPIFWALFVLFAIALLIWLIKRKKTDGEKKTPGVVASCVLNILLFLILLVPVFVFTGYKGLPVTGGYEIAQASAILVDESRTDSFENDKSAREVPVHFYYPVILGNENMNFPLVVFSHGAFGYYQSNFSTYEELASNGYVVAALDHPHHSFFTHDTDGNLIIVDQEYLQSAIDAENSDEGNESVIRLVEEEWMGIREPDMNFAITAIEEAKKDNVLSDIWVLPDTDKEEMIHILTMTDIDKIGVMGHSMGGATSVETGRERDDISAVIDIDGTMFAEYVKSEDGTYSIREDAYELPILEFRNWSHYNDVNQMTEDGINYPNAVLMKQAKEGYVVTIKNTEHMDFTDLPLLSPFLGDMLGSGKRDTKEAMTIVNSLVLDFYNCYLKDKGGFSPQEIY